MISFETMQFIALGILVPLCLVVGFGCFFYVACELGKASRKK